MAAGRALIAGGGIAGMAAALALARTGWRVAVHERAEGFAEVGAGLQISPNAARALDWLGLLDRAAAEGFAPRAAVLRDGRRGHTIYRAALGSAAEARWGAPYLHVHRADLLAALVEAAEAAGVALVTGSTVAGVLDPQAGSVRLGDGSTERADLVLAADGVRSGLRAAVAGPDAPHFTGQTAWRALVPAERLPSGLVAPEAMVWAGPGRHVVTYYLRGGRLVNLVAVEETGDWAEETWHLPGDPARLRAGFAGWHADVARLLAAVEAAHLWGLFLRPAPRTWVSGRVALVGDAAHAMLPFMAQGAAAALEDAVVLARCLAEREATAGLAAFEVARRPRVERIQARSRANGRLFHKRTPLGQLVSWGPIAAVSRLAPGVAAGQLDWLYGYDPTTVP